MADAPKAAIYGGSFWYRPLAEVLAQSPICKLNKRQLETVETSLSLHMREMPRDIIPLPGMTERTLLLPGMGLRIAYGKWSGQQICLHSLDGMENRGLFESADFYSLLREIERLNTPQRQSKSWWKLWLWDT